MTAFLDDRAEAHQIAVPVPHLRSHRHPRGQRADGSPVLPADRRWRPSRHARDEEPDDPRPGRLAARPHLRPQRPVSRHERRDIRGQTAAGRPPDRAAARRRRPAGRPARHDRGGHQRDHRREPWLDVRSRPHRQRRRCRHRTAHLRVRDGPAGRRGRRRSATAIHGRAADVPDPRVHRAGLGRPAEDAEAGRLPARRPARQGRDRGPVRDRAPGHLRDRERSSATARAGGSRCSRP